MNIDVDYWLPECSISVMDKTEIFAFRCEINDLPIFFGKSEVMNNEHILTCAHLKNGQLHNLVMENIRNGNIIEKI